MSNNVKFPGVDSNQHHIDLYQYTITTELFIQDRQLNNLFFEKSYEFTKQYIVDNLSHWITTAVKRAGSEAIQLRWALIKFHSHLYKWNVRLRSKLSLSNPDWQISHVNKFLYFIHCKTKSFIRTSNLFRNIHVHVYMYTMYTQCSKPSFKLMCTAGFHSSEFI